MSALDEFNHAISLVDEVIATGNTAGMMSVIEIDDVCTFDSGSGQCGKPIESALILMDEDTQKGRWVHAATYCAHHAELVSKAVLAIREKRKSETPKTKA